MKRFKTLRNVTVCTVAFSLGLGAARSFAQTNTSYGEGALSSVTVSDGSDTAFGFDALNATTSGINNTAVGANSLRSNTTGYRNAAIGSGATD